MPSVFFILLFSCALSWAKEVVLSPVGDYATIQTQQDIETIETLKSGNIQAKKSVAQKVRLSPENYNPVVLLHLGLWYLEQHDLQNAFHFMRAGVFRAVVDVAACKDNSIGDIIPIMMNLMEDSVLSYFEKNPHKKEIGLKAFLKATAELMAWDSKTPRNYDLRWPLLHSTKLIEAAMRGDASAKITTSSKKEYNSVLEKHRALYRKENNLPA